MDVNAETPVRHSQICVGMSASAGMSGRPMRNSQHNPEIPKAVFLTCVDTVPRVSVMMSSILSVMSMVAGVGGVGQRPASLPRSVATKSMSACSSG